jgi:hypothetical protein
MAQNLLKYDAQSRTHQKTDWFTILANEADSGATRTSGLFINYHSLGLMLHIKLANLASTPTFTPKILVPSGVSGDADIEIVAFTALTANGNSILVLYPVVLTDLGDEAKIATLPREWKLQLTFGGTGTSDTEVYGRYI